MQMQVQVGRCMKINASVCHRDDMINVHLGAMYVCISVPIMPVQVMNLCVFIPASHTVVPPTHMGTVVLACTQMPVYVHA